MSFKLVVANVAKCFLPLYECILCIRPCEWSPPCLRFSGRCIRQIPSQYAKVLGVGGRFLKINKNINIKTTIDPFPHKLNTTFSLLSNISV